MLTAHSHDFIDHVKAALGDLGAGVLFTNDFANWLVLGVFDVEQGFCLTLAHLSCLFLLQVLVHHFVSLHVSVVIFWHDVVALCMLRRLGSLRLGASINLGAGNSRRGFGLPGRV